jgi:hypothetical protein
MVQGGDFVNVSDLLVRLGIPVKLFVNIFRAMAPE